MTESSQKRSTIDELDQRLFANETWKKMDTETFSDKASKVIGDLQSKIVGNLNGDDAIRVIWLSSTLFFTVGAYWLLRSIKDPIISVIDGVDRIPQAKILSLVVVFALVVVYVYPKHHLFYMMGTAYGSLFFLISVLLAHPTIGLQNTTADPFRPLGWISYVAIESFGSMVIQSYWALVNSSVDVNFAKKNFGFIVAGAQIGSILGPTIATQAEYTGVPVLYFGASLAMGMMVLAMYFYLQRFGVPIEEGEGQQPDSLSKKVENREGEGVMEGFRLFLEHDYVKGLFAVSCLFNVQVTVIDYMMKVLAQARFQALHPDDPDMALRSFASFMGHFGQVTNSISFLFSLFGTRFVIQHLGLEKTLMAFPILLLGCTIAVFLSPQLWTVFAVMMTIKGMSYALNNPTKEILYQVTSTSIKFKCKSWIETFGQRGSKAAGSLITNAFANSIADLANYGSLAGVSISVGLLVVSKFMGRKFEELIERGHKIGESP